MIVAAFTAAGVALVAVGVLIGLWLTATVDDGFDDDDMGAWLDALRSIWERTMWEQGYTPAAEASGRKRDPGAK